MARGSLAIRVRSLRGAYVTSSIVGFLHALGLQRRRGSGEHGRAEPHEVAEAHELFQVSTLNAIMEGVFDGELTIGELRRHGDFGVGTFNALDGELVAVDGEFYRLAADGSAAPAPDDLKTPFAVVQHFRAEASTRLSGPMGVQELTRAIHDLAGSDNYFFGVRVDGSFDAITVRVVPKQEPPYPTLLEATSRQSEFELSGSEGTIVGFRFPDFSQGINMTGLHLHFLSDDRSAGGHVLDFRLQSGTLGIDHASGFRLELPEVGAFGNADLAADQTDAIRRAEGLEG